LRKLRALEKIREREDYEKNIKKKIDEKEKEKEENIRKAKE